MPTKPLIERRKLKKFSRWLSQNGAEVLPAIRKREVLRFQFLHPDRKNISTGIVYQDMSVNQPYVNEVYDNYAQNKPWRSGPQTPRNSATSKMDKMLLFARDGPQCFYCGVEFELAQMTVEHVLSRAAGGSNRIENKTLSCTECNGEAGHLSVAAKVRLRDKKRGYYEASHSDVQE